MLTRHLGYFRQFHVPELAIVVVANFFGVTSSDRASKGLFVGEACGAAKRSAPLCGEFKKRSGDGAAKSGVYDDQIWNVPRLVWRDGLFWGHVRTCDQTYQVCLVCLHASSGGRELVCSCCGL